MNKSETLGKLAKALADFQADMPTVKKATSAYNYKYADLADVWRSCRDQMKACGLSVTQVSEPHETGLMLETILMHSSGEWISGTMLMPLVKRDPQGFGSSHTYARRYGLCAILGIVADEDDDGARGSGKTENPEFDQRPPWEKKDQAPPPNMPPPPPPSPPPATLPPPKDYLGTGPAKKKEAKLKALCTDLNKAGCKILLDDLTPEETAAGGLVYNSENLNRYAMNGFDTQLKDLSDTEMAVLITDLSDTLKERQAIQGENEPVPATTNVTDFPTHSGSAMATEKQVSSLTKLAGIKGKVESQVAEAASSGRVGTFAALTETEAGEAITTLTKG